jgi:hypothetical protein
MIRLPNIGDRLRRVREVAQNVEASFVNDEPGFVQVETMLKRYTSQLLSERNDAHFKALHGALFGNLRRSDGNFGDRISMRGRKSEILATIPPKRRSRWPHQISRRA